MHAWLGATAQSTPSQTVLLAKEVFPYLTGRVHAQTSPRLAYDTEGTVTHAQKLVSLFEANGIPKFDLF